MTTLERWLCAALLTVCACAMTIAAPAPFAKPDRGERRIKPLDVRGRWSVLWTAPQDDGTIRTFACEMEFRADGTYQHSIAGTEFTGSWQFANGLLSVAETADPTNPLAWKCWAVKLVGLSGVTETDRDLPGRTITIKRLP